MLLVDSFQVWPGRPFCILMLCLHSLANENIFHQLKYHCSVLEASRDCRHLTTLKALRQFCLVLVFYFAPASL